MKNFLCALTLFLFIFSCGKSLKTKVKNSDVVTVLDGRDKPDTVRYTCDSCEKYITSVTLNKIIDQATKEAKASLKNPLSFIPRSIKISVSPRDSFYYYVTNKHVDSCLVVNIEYKCIGKNAYGVENEVVSSPILFLVGDSLHENFVDEIRLAPLKLSDDGRTVTRSLSLYDINKEGDFTILPIVTKPNSLILTSSNSCIDKGAYLQIIFEDISDITLKNYNDFNCKGTAYFNLSSKTMEQLQTKKVSHIVFNADKLQMAKVKPNDSEYFMQYVKLISK